MQRLVGIISIDSSGTTQMRGMLESLSVALATAQIDEPLDVNYADGGLCFQGCEIVRIAVSGPLDWTMFLSATPTFFLPLFASEVCRIAPGVKVRWVEGWPHFFAIDGDDRVEGGPDPVKPEMVGA